MKIYDVYVEQIDIINSDKRETRSKRYQVVGTDLQQAIFCAGQIYHENGGWATEKLRVCTPDGKENYETVFEGWK